MKGKGELKKTSQLFFDFGDEKKFERAVNVTRAIVARCQCDEFATGAPSRDAARIEKQPIF
jgi:hypothetical protein